MGAGKSTSPGKVGLVRTSRLRSAGYVISHVVRGKEEYPRSPRVLRNDGGKKVYGGVSRWKVLSSPGPRDQLMEAAAAHLNELGIYGSVEAIEGLSGVRKLAILEAIVNERFETGQRIRLVAGSGVAFAMFYDNFRINQVNPLLVDPKLSGETRTALSQPVAMSLTLEGAVTLAGLQAIIQRLYGMIKLHGKYGKNVESEEREPHFARLIKRHILLQSPLSPDSVSTRVINLHGLELHEALQLQALLTPQDAKTPIIFHVNDFGGVLAPYNVVVWWGGAGPVSILRSFHVKTASITSVSKVSITDASTDKPVVLTGEAKDAQEHLLAITQSFARRIPSYN